MCCLKVDIYKSRRLASYITSMFVLTLTGNHSLKVSEKEWKFPDKLDLWNPEHFSNLWESVRLLYPEEKELDLYSDK
jgi:hypothetical protein